MNTSKAVVTTRASENRGDGSAGVRNSGSQTFINNRNIFTFLHRFPGFFSRRITAKMNTFKDEVNRDWSHWDTTLKGVECPPQGDAFELGCLDRGNGFCYFFGINGRIPYPAYHLPTQSCWPYAVPSVLAPQPMLCHMPVTSDAGMELGNAWTPTGRDNSYAVACIVSDRREHQEEDMSIIEEMAREPLSQTCMEKCEPSLLVKLLSSDFQVFNSACGTVIPMNNSKLVQMNPMHCVPSDEALNAPQNHYQIPSVSRVAPAELCDPRGEETSILGQMVSPMLAGSHPIMNPPYLPSPSPPFIQPAPCFLTPTYHVSPVASESSLSYSSHPGPVVSQLNQSACSVYPDSKRLQMKTQPKMPPMRNPGTSLDSRSRKPCSCVKCQCLKFYCECFANGDLCVNCNCVNCFNNIEHEYERDKVIKMCLGRNPHAFQPKIGNRKLGRVQGCSCKRSSCQKNYCECYGANVMCSSTCKCVGCKNYNETSKKTMRPCFLLLPSISVFNRCPLACITSDVVEATCGYLIALAEEAGKEGYTLAQAEKMILQEFWPFWCKSSGQYSNSQPCKSSFDEEDIIGCL
ncbi:hypothetical protein GN956_G19882 [Arapaima gigas]